MASVSETIPMGARDTAARRAGLVRVHLLMTALLVVAIIVVGGATRLTESGLSITEWNLVTGILPPLDAAGWQAEFERYQRIPQYLEVNRGMSLAAFQTIYLWEWGHRLLGRVIGVFYLAGVLGFALARWLDRAMLLKLAGVGVLIALQGAVGWWMVRSGLADRVTVAPYRLAIHLTLALAVFACLLWLAQDLQPRARASGGKGRGAGWLVALVFVQVALGGLVAGTRSGWVYQDWPLMDGGFSPSGMAAMTPWWRNLFENTGTTQFLHRVTAYLVLVAAALHWLAVRRHAVVARGAAILVGTVLVQAALGVAALLSGMHILVALAHQAWITAVLAVAVLHWHRLARG